MSDTIIPRLNGTRAEHLAFCKERALEYLPGDPPGALASLFSDMSKHAETRDHASLKNAGMLIFAGQLQTSEQVRKYIEGFN